MTIYKTAFFLFVFYVTNSYTEEVIDFNGKVVLVEDTSRIVSLGGAVTEIVFALGFGEKVVGVDASSSYPEAVNDIAKVSYHRRLSAEGIISLAPTLIIATTEAGPPEVIQQLRSAGVTILILPHEPTVECTIEKIQINTGMASSDSQPEQVAEVAEAVAEVESAMEEESESESESEEKEDSKETKEGKAKAVEAIVNRVLQAVEMAGGDADSTKLALMGILGAQGFRSYQQQSIPDVAFYDTTVSYESPTYNDPLGAVFSLGSNQMMDAMTDVQYE